MWIELLLAVGFLSHIALAERKTTPPPSSLDYPWTWTCERYTCVKQARTSSSPVVPLATCQMSCGQLPLWPYPTRTVRVSNSSSAFRPSQMSVEITNAGPVVYQALQQAATILRRNLRRLIPSNVPFRLPSDITQMSISLLLTGHENDVLNLTLATNETYRLVVSHISRHVNVRVYGETFFAIRHGLETLSQLVWWDGLSLRLLDDVFIVDEPQFAYRGLMVDTSRNFMPLQSLKITIDAMAASKLNAFHWHLSDSHSFPFDSPRVPNMSLYGAYSPDKVYSAADVKELTQYALERGVRVIAEIDAPAHAGNGWQWGPASGLGKLSLCVNRQPWERYCGQPPCGQLNPDNEHSYRVLGQLYRDLVELTNPTDVFHLGGDEVNMDCWRSELWDDDSTAETVSFMDKWLLFEERALSELRAAYGNNPPSTVVVWSSELTNTGRLDPNAFTVQVWGASSWPDTVSLLQYGYKIIISHVDAWYLDCGLGDYRKAGEGPCGPFATWQSVYMHQPWRTTLPPSRREQVLGGEACLWTERSDHQVLDSRLWPRAAALAERLWTDPEADLPSGEMPQPDGLNDRNFMGAFHRISVHRERLVSRGVRADAVHPEWCHQNPSQCF
ncbi:probable beta-hexosaminidase fdl isoform X2 [Anabrus simplex]|uniref:probable beta-hexosaminidase fdl isoform X2 n=1 Tax=Anabrus simplex TaxID=316456 RepID=UPI0035A3CB2B